MLRFDKLESLELQQESFSFLNLKRSLLQMHPKFEATQQVHSKIEAARETSELSFYESFDLEAAVSKNVSEDTRRSPDFGFALGLYSQCESGAEDLKISRSQMALSRRENEKELIRHSVEWISKKEHHSCR